MQCTCVLTVTIMWGQCRILYLDLMSNYCNENNSDFRSFLISTFYDWHCSACSIETTADWHADSGVEHLPREYTLLPAVLCTGVCACVKPLFLGWGPCSLMPFCFMLKGPRSLGIAPHTWDFVLSVLDGFRKLLYSCLHEAGHRAPGYMSPETCSKPPDCGLCAPLGFCVSLVPMTVRWEQSLHSAAVFMPWAHMLCHHTTWILATCHFVNLWCCGVLQYLRGYT